MTPNLHREPCSTCAACVAASTPAGASGMAISSAARRSPRRIYRLMSKRKKKGGQRNLGVHGGNQPINVALHLRVETVRPLVFECQRIELAFGMLVVLARARAQVTLGVREQLVRAVVDKVEGAQLAVAQIDLVRVALCVVGSECPRLSAAAPHHTYDAPPAACCGP